LLNNFKDLVYFSILSFFSVIIVYYFPAFTSIFFLFTTVLFFYTKAEFDYFWIVYVLVIVNNPGNLFFNMTDEIMSIGFLQLSFLQIFGLSAMLKIFIKRDYKINQKVFYFKEGRLYLFWLVGLLIIGVVIGLEGGGRTGLRYYYYYMMTFVIFPIFFVMPHLLKDYKDLINFFRLISIITILNFIAQVYNVLFFASLHTLLGGIISESADDSTTFRNFARMLRPLYFYYGIFFTYVLSIFFHYSNEKKFSRFFLNFIFSLSLLSIIITATRGWILGFFLFLISILFIDTIFTKKFIPLKIILGLILVSFILVLSVPSIEEQFTRAIDRFETLAYVFEGDATAGGTNVRLTTRFSPVWEKIQESPIWGWGFSNIGMKTHDRHVGFLSPMLIGGVIGVIILIYFVFRLYYKYIRLSKRLPSYNKFKKSSIILITSIMILVVISFTSGQLFGYYNYVEDGGKDALFISIFLSILNTVYYGAIKERNEDNHDIFYSDRSKRRCKTDKVF
jgi:O-Antigen ligase